MSSRRERPRERARDGGVVRTHRAVMDYVPFLSPAPMAPDKIVNAKDPANWRRGVW